MVDWKQLRETVLTYPVAESNKDERPIPVKIIPSLYTKLQRDDVILQYQSNSLSEDDSFRDVTIGVKGGSKVSEQNCNLEVMMKIPEVKQYFQERGYATSFEPGKYILSPALYNRIYKGALREAAGCAILEREWRPFLSKSLGKVDFRVFAIHNVKSIYSYRNNHSLEVLRCPFSTRWSVQVNEKDCVSPQYLHLYLCVPERRVRCLRNRRRHSCGTCVLRPSPPCR